LSSSLPTPPPPSAGAAAARGGGSGDDGLARATRRACMRLLMLEHKALRWYALPARRYLEDLTARLGAAFPRHLAGGRGGGVAGGSRATTAACSVMAGAVAKTPRELVLAAAERRAEAAARARADGGDSGAPSPAVTPSPHGPHGRAPLAEEKLAGVAGQPKPRVDPTTVTAATTAAVVPPPPLPLDAMRRFVEAEAEALETALFAMPSASSGDSRLPDALRPFLDVTGSSQDGAGGRGGRHSDSDDDLDDDVKVVVKAAAAPVTPAHPPEEVIAIDDDDDGNGGSDMPLLPAAKLFPAPAPREEVPRHVECVEID